MNPVPKSSQSIWNTFNNGATIAQKGSEQGVVLRDEEHQLGARITLERDGCTAPFSITCGIYGLFVHTAFATSETEALQKYVAMQQRLEQIIALDEDDVSPQLNDFADAF